jgi:hypothetical protein
VYNKYQFGVDSFFFSIMAWAKIGIIFIVGGDFSWVCWVKGGVGERI